MIRSTYEQSVAWATQLRNRLLSDEFIVARLKIAALFFLIGLLISVVVNDIIDGFVRDSVYQVALLDTGPPVEAAFRHIQQQLWLARAIKLLLFGVSAYFLADYAMRPLRRTSDYQKRLIATVSHELRTPLAVMRTGSQVALRKGERLALPEAREVIASNLEEIERASRIITFLLAFAAFSERKKVFTLLPISLRSIVERAQGLIDKTLNDTHAVIQVESHVEGKIRGDATALEEVVINLVRNALDHTPSEGEIYIRLSETSSTVELHVQDTGIGIAEKDIPHLFKPFYRGGITSARTSRDGLGLGLALVQEIVTLHNGHVEVTSALGVGTTVSLSFPRAKRPK